ncbi:hypothetical protein KAJ27_21735 [bacterium]|nr:hypothetical protein [bacterium]
MEKIKHLKENWINGIFFILIFLILFLFFKYRTDFTPLKINSVKTAVNRAAEYLKKSTKKNGMFRYRVSMNPAVKVKDSYNILRHAGTIFSMVTYYNLKPEVKMREAIDRACRYLNSEAINPIGNTGMLAVWSKPEVNHTESHLQAKLGGTGLGLVALLSFEKINPGFTPLSKLRSLGNFLVYMQKENGGFYSKYIPELGGRSEKWNSLYYPGEAALGLLMLYEKDNSDVWFKSAVKALTCLARNRKSAINIPADHWALLATEKLFSIPVNNKLPVSRQLLMDHAVQICNSILKSQIDNYQYPNYNGGFSDNGKTTPTATRLEGLLAALSFLPANHKIRNKIKKAIYRGIPFLIRAQVKEGDFIGAFPQAISINSHRDQDPRVNEVQIDYVQHALSAMIQYLKHYKLQ